MTVVARLSFIAPLLIRPNELGDISLINPRTIAAALAAIVAWRFRNTWLTLLVGMIALWILTLP